MAIQFEIPKHATIRDIRNIVSTHGPCVTTIIPSDVDPEAPDFMLVAVNGTMESRYVLAALEVVYEELDMADGGDRA